MDLKEKLGDYHNRVRNYLGVSKKVLPDEMIDAPLHINAALAQLMMELGQDAYLTDPPETLANQINFVRAYCRFLAAFICPALESKTRIAEYARYRKNYHKLAQQNLSIGRAHLKQIK